MGELVRNRRAKKRTADGLPVSATERVRRRATELLDLNYDCLEIILRSLPEYDLDSMAATCIRFRDICRDIFERYLLGDDKSLTINYDTTNKWLTRTLLTRIRADTLETLECRGYGFAGEFPRPLSPNDENYPKLKRFKCTFIKGASLQCLAPARSLEHLDIMLLADEKSLGVVCQFQNLRVLKLNLHYSKRFCSSRSVLLLQNLNQIVELELLHHMRHVNEHGTLGILTPFLANLGSTETLQRLRIAGCGAREEATTALMQALQRFHNLRYLHFGELKNISIMHLLRLENLDKVREMNLEYWPPVSKKKLVALIAYRMTQLEVLRLDEWAPHHIESLRFTGRMPCQVAHGMTQLGALRHSEWEPDQFEEQDVVTLAETYQRRHKKLLIYSECFSVTLNISRQTLRQCRDSVEFIEL